MNPPASPPSPTPTSAAAATEAVRDVYGLFDDTVPSPIRPFYAPLLPDDSTQTAARTRKSGAGGRNNRVDGCPSPLKQKRRTQRLRVSATEPASIAVPATGVGGAAPSPPAPSLANPPGPDPKRVSRSPDLPAFNVTVGTPSRPLVRRPLPQLPQPPLAPRRRRRNRAPSISLRRWF